MLKLIGAAGVWATFPIPLLQKDLAAQVGQGQKGSVNSDALFSDWLSEARIGGLSISGFKIDAEELEYALDQAVTQKVNVIEADSRLSDYVSDEDFVLSLQLIKETTDFIHERGLKVVWYLPALEVITPNGRTRKDSFARTHEDWLQVSFDGEQQAYFYGKKAFWVTSEDESAWLCPNSPYRAWLKKRLSLLAKTGVDGLWLDVPVFDQLAVDWGCACRYCRAKFRSQTGMEFPSRIDLQDQRFWRWLQWRHETLTEFLNDCKQTIESQDSQIITIAEIVAPDHLGATRYGTEGSQLRGIQLVWEVQGVSETTAMAEASYDDWTIMHSVYKYCRGASGDRPSWALSYGYNDSDAQLVMASAVAAQNNPYELLTPEMTSTVGIEFRQMMYGWIAQHSKQIFGSRSLAPVAIIYSERNRDFLDAVHNDGLYLDYAAPGRDRRWLADKQGSPLRLEYMGDYRGLSVFFYQHQVPADIYPFSRVDVELLKNYRVIVLPYMVMLTEDEKETLLNAVRAGATLIVTGPQPGVRDADGRPRKRGIWSNFIDRSNDNQFVTELGKGRICFWMEHVGRGYLKTHHQDIAAGLLSWVKAAGVQPWVTTRKAAVVQPYIYGDQIIIHVLNYDWVGALENQPKPISLELNIPWNSKKAVKSVVQSVPHNAQPKALTYSIQGGKMIIPVQVDINALVLIET